MADVNKTAETAQIMHSLGQLTGAVTALQQGLTARIEDTVLFAWGDKCADALMKLADRGVFLRPQIKNAA